MFLEASCCDHDSARLLNKRAVVTALHSSDVGQNGAISPQAAPGGLFCFTLHPVLQVPVNHGLQVAQLINASRNKHLYRHG